MRDEENDRNRSDRYEYRAYYSSSKNGKKILEVDQDQSLIKRNVLLYEEKSFQPLPVMVGSIGASQKYAL